MSLLHESIGRANTDDGIAFFESDVRPVLVERCHKCHGAKKQSGGLRLDSRHSIVRGGDSGAAIVAGDADASLLVRAIRHEGDIQMPPDEKLTDSQIAVIERWVELGAPWPSDVGKPADRNVGRTNNHWAFQPVREPAVPVASSPDWIRTPIDNFVLARLDEAGLTPSSEADRRTLIRRIYYTLTGLPPSYDEVEAFVRDDDPRSYERLVDRLLDSPHYGEQWARHWLDVARYSDTKGYVYAREERFWVHAWAYRDWVVQALNEDMAYDRFLLLQLAADQVEDCRQSDLAAKGFLTIGRRFLGVKRDIIDDRIDAVFRGTMGLTVACARCHDHKYDPIPTEDYYSMYGVFDSSVERLVRLDAESDDEAFETELAKRQNALQSALQQSRREVSSRVRDRVADYLQAQFELDQYPEEGFDQVLQTSDLLPSFVRRWQTYLHDAAGPDDPVFAAWHAFTQIPEEDLAAQAAEIARQLRADASRMNPIVIQAFATPPSTRREVIDRYADVFARIDADWQSLLKAAADEGRDPPTALDDPAAEQLRRVLYGRGAPCEVPDLPIVHIEYDVDSDTCTRLWKLQGEVDRWIIQSKQPSRYALTLVDSETPVEPRVFRRGNPANKGPEVPRRYLSLFAGPNATPFQRGSGRLELARAIIDPHNPLAARVIVNRVWAHHFGTGLVDTPSDFGTRAETPSHPDLLDWLAARFVADGWSLKQLHRWILLSAAYRQSSLGPENQNVVQRAVQLDPANRLLWRMNAHRLSFEEMRDSLLASAGDLDLQLGGKPVELFKEPFSTRRTLYGLVDRQFLPGTLRVFDFANPDLHTPQRSETTVPQQALFLLNHPAVLQRVRGMAAAVEPTRDVQQAVRQLFRRTLQRDPTDEQIADALDLIAASASVDAPATRATTKDWSYGFAFYDESSQRVTGFTPLPHFTGGAWQGGPNWPDAKLGWVQLTAAGGHPGNDRQHACVRRWTAPRAMRVAIESRLAHNANPGDGVRAFIVSSRGGLLSSTKAHQQTVDLNRDEVAVEQGDTIDFVVDIGDVLNSDQFEWNSTIRTVAGAEDAVIWNSQQDFTHDTVAPLTPWEQLAQILLCSNEFIFVD